MVDWLTWTLIIAGLFGAVFALISYPLWKRPNDLHIFVAGAIALLLLVQVAFGISNAIVGEGPSGNTAEWWLYLITALVVVLAGTIWSFVDPNKWSLLIHAAIGITIAVMVYRMHQIWFIQIA